MTDQEDDTTPPEKPKQSIKRFLFEMAAPVPFQSEGLGRIITHRATGTTERELAKRLANSESVGDRELVKIYMGCASGFPTDDPEKLPEPLTEEQVSQFSEADIDAFVIFYLKHVAKEPLGDDPVASLATFIRKQKHESDEANKRMSDSLNKQFRDITQASTIMENWSDLQKTFGSVSTLQSQIENTLGPNFSIQDVVNKALRSPFDDVSSYSDKYTNGLLQEHMKGFEAPYEEFSSIAEKIKKDSVQDQMDAILNKDRIGYPSISDRDYLRIEPPIYTPIEDTPIGRAPQASEDLVEAANQIRDSMDGILQQVGRVTSHIAEVSQTIRDQADTFLKEGARQNTQARRFAVWSIGLAALALIVSALLTLAGFIYDRKENSAGGVDTKAMVQATNEQNELLKQVITQQKLQLDQQREELDKASSRPKQIQTSAPTIGKTTPSTEDSNPHRSQ